MTKPRFVSNNKEKAASVQLMLISCVYKYSSSPHGGFDYDYIN